MVVADWSIYALHSFFYYYWLVILVNCDTDGTKIKALVLLFIMSSWYGDGRVWPLFVCFAGEVGTVIYWGDKYEWVNVDRKVPKLEEHITLNKFIYTKHILRVRAFFLRQSSSYYFQYSKLELQVSGSEIEARSTIIQISRVRGSIVIIKLFIIYFTK